LLFLLNAACLADKHTIQMLVFDLIRPFTVKPVHLTHMGLYTTFDPGTLCSILFLYHIKHFYRPLCPKQTPLGPILLFVMCRLN